MRGFLRKALATAGAIGVFTATGLALAPAASASSGGGCNEVYYFGGYANVSACISAINAAVYPDAYVQWENAYPFSSCHVTVDLLDNNTGAVVNSRTWSCGTGHPTQTHFGPFASAGQSGTKWRTHVIVTTDEGTEDAAYSPVETLTY